MRLIAARSLALAVLVGGCADDGGGWGHGVGLSQTGAAGMADKNARYEKTLLHYYQGTELQTWAY